MATKKMTDYLLLGLLSHEPMTGYEMKRRLDTTLALFWNASYGSIYPTLAQLEQEEKIIGKETSVNKRNRITYEITKAGEDYLKEWLHEPPERDEIRYETLLKLFFGGNVGTERNLCHIADMRKRMEQELPYLKESVRQLEAADGEEAHKYYRLTALFGVKFYEASLAWCEEAEKILKEQEKSEEES